jgi:hypothetical protein
MGIYLGGTELSSGGGGGGGFTKQNKYSTYRSNDANYKTLASLGLKANTNNLQSSATTRVYYITAVSGQDMTAADAFVGFSFITGGRTYVITSSGANNGIYDDFDITTTNNGQNIPISFNWFAADPPKTFNGGPLTVNPATDLGLEDGSQIGYMLVGAGYSSGSNDYGGRGGKIISGTSTIVTASTDLIFTPGVANGGSSTISGGGLALSSGDGSNASGFGDFNANNSVVFAGGSGIMGYGVGGGRYNSSARNVGTNYHGYGVGAFTTSDGGDGAILLFY